MNLRLKTTIFIIFLSCFSSNFAFARFSLIRDAETEKFLRTLTKPIFEAANLNQKDISIYIVNDSSLNAFVMGGQNIFIHTGLIRKYENPQALIGVIAHEVGHIVGGHIARSSEEINKAQNAMLLSYLLGIGAAVAGSAEAAQGIILGGNNVAEKLYLKYSRTQEEAADSYALQYLEKMNYSPQGLIDLLEVFQLQMRGYEDYVNEYTMSHPVSKKRIDYLKNNAKNHKFDDKLDKKLQPFMTRILFKLEAFIDDPNQVLRKYKNDESENANYAKSIAYYKKGEIEKSLKLLDEIIKNNKNDGFLYELKAQILYESGNIKDAILSYKKAIDLLEIIDSNQARIYFAVAIISLKQNNSDLINLAIANLKIAEKFEKQNPFLFKNLAAAYNKINDEARSMAALAEYNFLVDDLKKSKKYANNAKEKFQENKNQQSIKTDLLKIQDLLELIEEKEKEKNKGKN